MNNLFVSDTLEKLLREFFFVQKNNTSNIVQVNQTSGILLIWAVNIQCCLRIAAVHFNTLITKKIKYCCLGNLLSFSDLWHLSDLPAYFEIFFFPSNVLRKINYVKSFACQSSSFHLFISVYVNIRSRDRWDQNRAL